MNSATGDCKRKDEQSKRKMSSMTGNGNTFQRCLVCSWRCKDDFITAKAVFLERFVSCARDARPI